MSSAEHLFSALMVDPAGPVRLAEGACGPDLEYAPPFLDFMSRAQGKPEQQLGTSIIPAQDPEWREVLTVGIALASTTRDLRIAVVLTHAATEVYGLHGLVSGLALVLNWLSAHWEEVHPTLDIDGEHDPLIRSNALSYLYAANGGMKAVRRARLMASPLGEVSVGDAENLLKGRVLADDALINTPEQLAHLLTDEYAHNSDTFAALRQAAALQHEIASLWKTRLEAEYWPDFESLQELLERLLKLVPKLDAGDSGRVPMPSAAQAIDAAPGTQSITLPAALHNRRDAFRTLALARQYFEHYEPSHPAPLLIQRIEKLEPLGFAQIISELTPDALVQLKQLVGGST